MDEHRNLALSTIEVPPSPALSGTTFTIQSADIGRFPNPPFNVTVCPAGVTPTPLNAEICRVVNIAASTWTVVRAQELSVARAIAHGDQVANTITVKALTDIEDILNDLVSAGAGVSQVPPAVFSMAGTLAVTNGRAIWEITQDCTVDYATISVGIAPDGADVIADVNKNIFDGGGSIFPTSLFRPTVLDGAQRGRSLTPELPNLVVGDYLTMDIAQVGSIFAGSDITLKVVFL